MNMDKFQYLYTNDIYGSLSEIQECVSNSTTHFFFACQTDSMLVNTFGASKSAIRISCSTVKSLRHFCSCHFIMIFQKNHNK